MLLVAIIRGKAWRALSDAVAWRGAGSVEVAQATYSGRRSCSLACPVHPAPAAAAAAAAAPAPAARGEAVQPTQTLDSANRSTTALCSTSRARPIPDSPCKIHHFEYEHHHVKYKIHHV